TLAVYVSVILIASGVPQAEYDQVVQKVDSLQAELDAANIELAEFKSAPEIFLHDAKRYLAADNFEAAKLMLEALIIQHPNSSYTIEANQMLADLESGQMNNTDTLPEKE